MITSTHTASGLPEHPCPKHPPEPGTLLLRLARHRSCALHTSSGASWTRRSLSSCHRCQSSRAPASGADPASSSREAHSNQLPHCALARNIRAGTEPFGRTSRRSTESCPARPHACIQARIVPLRKLSPHHDPMTLEQKIQVGDTELRGALGGLLDNASSQKASTSSVPAPFIRPTMHLATWGLTLAAAGSSASVLRARMT